MTDKQFAMPAMAEWGLLCAVLCVVFLAYAYVTADISRDGRFVLTEECAAYGGSTEIEDPRTGAVATYDDCLDAYTGRTPVSIWFQERVTMTLIGSAVLATVIVGMRRNW